MFAKGSFRDACWAESLPSVFPIYMREAVNTQLSVLFWTKIADAIGVNRICMQNEIGACVVSRLIPSDLCIPAI